MTDAAGDSSIKLILNASALILTLATSPSPDRVIEELLRVRVAKLCGAGARASQKIPPRTTITSASAATALTGTAWFFQNAANRSAQLLFFVPTGLSEIYRWKDVANF